MSPISPYCQFSLVLFIICSVVWHSSTKHQVTKILREYDKTNLIDHWASLGHTTTIQPTLS